jgi:plastocyanin
VNPPKVFRLLFAATVVAGLSAPMLASAAPRKSSVDTYLPPKGFFVPGAPDPKVLEISLYDTVTWNIMEGEHTVTPDDTKKWGDAGSDTLKPETSGSYVADHFKSVGDYTYHCKLHEDMTGTIRVIDTTPTTQPPATQPPATQPPATQPPATTTTRPSTPPATTATAPTTPVRPGPTAPAPTTTTAKDKKPKDPKDETTTTSSTLPPPIDLPDSAIIPTLPGASTTSSADPGANAEAPAGTPEGEAVALLKGKKDKGGGAMKMLIVSGLGLGALGIGSGAYKYANRSSKYFPA